MRVPDMVFSTLPRVGSPSIMNPPVVVTWRLRSCARQPLFPYSLCEERCRSLAVPQTECSNTSLPSSRSYYDNIAVALNFIPLGAIDELGFANRNASGDRLCIQARHGRAARKWLASAGEAECRVLRLAVERAAVLSKAMDTRDCHPI